MLRLVSSQVYHCLVLDAPPNSILYMDRMMDVFWLFLLVVWVVVEVIQFFRKIPFPRRMIAPLVSTICVGGLIGVGSAPPGHSGQDAVRFLTSAVMVAVFASIFYGFRLLLDKAWHSNAKLDSEVLDSNPALKSQSMWKKLLASAALVLAGMATVTLSIAGYDLYRKKQEEITRKAERDALKLLEDAVLVTAYLPKEGCSGPYPYAYQIENKSTEVVERVDFDIAIRKAGFSKRLNTYDAHPIFSSDKILKPGESWAMCFKANVAGYPFATGEVTEKDVEFEISQMTVKFKGK